MCLTVLPSIAPQFPGVFIHPSIFNIETWAFSVAARTLRNFLPVNALLNLCFQEFNHNRSCLIILNINHDTNSGVSRISQRGSQGEAGGGRGKPIHSCYHVVAQWKNTVKKKNIKPKGSWPNGLLNMSLETEMTTYLYSASARYAFSSVSRKCHRTCVHARHVTLVCVTCHKGHLAAYHFVVS